MKWLPLHISAVFLGIADDESQLVVGDFFGIQTQGMGIVF